jgi:hypothetical protein
MNVDTDIAAQHRTREDGPHAQSNIIDVRLLAKYLITRDGGHAMMADKWCPYDLIWILKNRIVGGRVAVLPNADADGYYSIEMRELKALWSIGKIPRPEFLAIAPVDKWFQYPVFLHRSEIVKGSVLRFGAAEFTCGVASDRMRRCAELIVKAHRSLGSL